MRKKERYEKVIAWFQENVPVAETELHYKDRKSTRLNSSHRCTSRMPSSA